MYLGNFDSFRFVAESAIDANTIITAGGMMGVTRANVPAGEIGMAFMAQSASVYTFTVDALSEAKTVGTAIYLDGDGAITFDANDGEQTPTAYVQLGFLWKPADAGATEIAVALK